MLRIYETVLDFLKRHERPLATFLFISGFVGDLLTFGLLDLRHVTLLFAAYLAFVMAATVVGHVTHGRTENAFVRSLSVLAPLFAQFTFGSLLSGFLIFYTKSAVFSVSWPFIILIAIIFFGNEVFRNYREHLIFQTLLIYFCLYAFFLFALPVYLGKLGTTIFLASSAATVVTFGLYTLILRLSGKSRFRSALLPIIASTSVITILVVGSYLTGLLPPIPLTLKAEGIYHSIVREDGNYTVTGEAARPWWDVRSPVVHHVPGTPLFAYSAVFAPGAFSAGIVHEWQRYDETAKKWVTESTIAFPLSGGREGGYRGYSLKDNPAAGKWRVLVQTMDGQTIGKFNFTVQSVSQTPSLTTQTL